MNLIAVADQEWGIGKNGAQPVFIPEDLARFRALTMGKDIIYGRKTLLTFPGARPLEGRNNLILSADPDFQVQGAQVFRSVKDLLKAAHEDAFVIGGEAVYRQLLPFCDTAYITRIDTLISADRFFPDLDAEDGWDICGKPDKHRYGTLAYSYVLYKNQCNTVREL